MANIKSQKKRIITNEKARMRNRAVRSELKTATRAVKDAVEAKDGKAALEAAHKACRLLDRAVTKGVVHKNQAANRKSGIMKLANSVATDADKKAYEAPKKKAPEKVAGGSKKAVAKAEKQKAMAAASKAKDKNRAATQKAQAAAEKKKAKEAAEAEKAEAATEAAAE